MGIIIVAALLGAALALFNPTSQYLEQQAFGEARLLLSAKPVPEVLKSGEVTPLQRDRILLIEEAKQYGQDHLGLRHTDNYTRYVDLGKARAVTWVVSAAPKDKLVPYTWWFPIVGSVPYKGYFSKDQALAEEHRLQARGLDASVRGVAAYSLLGFLPDPITSPMLLYRPAVLANIIIHESTHATLWIQSNATFNEGMATFVGNQGSIDFLSARYGPESPQTRYARDSQADDRVFAGFIHRVLANLRTLYDSPVSEQQKLARREVVFAQAKREFAALPFKTDEYRGFEQAHLNNAYLLEFATYYTDLSRFRKVYDRLGHDMPRYITFFKAMAKDPHPEEATDRWLANPATPSATPEASPSVQ